MGFWEKLAGAYEDPMVKAAYGTQAKQALETPKLVDAALAKAHPEAPAPDFMSGILSPTRTEGSLPPPAPDDAKLRSAAALIPRPSNRPMQADPLAAKVAALDSTGPGTGGSGPAQSAAPSVPAPAPTPKAAGKSPEEMAFDAAQKASDDMGTRQTISNILGAFTSDSAGIQKRNAEARQKPLQDLANKYNYLQQVRENNAKNAQAQRQADMGDASSPLTKRNAAMLYAAYGIQPPADFTADQTADYVAASKLKGEQREKELNRLREEAHDKSTEGLTRRGQDIQLQMERERGKTALAEKQLGAGAGKAIPDQMTPKISAQVDAPAIINELKKKQADVGLSGVLSQIPFVPTFGAQKEYENAVNASVGPLSLAMFPGAKSESPELTKMAKDALPKGYTMSDTASNQFGNIDRNTRRALDTELKALEAGGASPREIAAYRQQLAASSAPEQPADSGTGPVQMMDPKGKVRLIPRDQAQAALAAGGKLVGG